MTTAAALLLAIWYLLVSQPSELVRVRAKGKARFKRVYYSSRLMALLAKCRLMKPSVSGWCPRNIHVARPKKDADPVTVAHEFAHVVDIEECPFPKLITHPARSLYLMWKHGYRKSPLEVRAYNAQGRILRGEYEDCYVDPAYFEGVGA